MTNDKKNYNQNPHQYALNDLIEIQKTSFYWFLKEGLIEEIEKFSPIVDVDKKFIIYFSAQNFRLKNPKISPEEAKKNETTYGAKLYIPFNLVNNFTGETVYSRLDVGEIPIMTDRGTFVINGSERVVVNQIIRSPGIYFKLEYDKHNNPIYSATLIPHRGSWLKFELDKNSSLWVKFDQISKVLATSFLKALGFKKKDILENVKHLIYFQDKIVKFYDKPKEKEIIEIYQSMQIVEDEKGNITHKFTDTKKYDLGKIGRIKINKKLGLDISDSIRIITNRDILAIIDYLIGLSFGIGSIDDIDHLGNRRIRSVGELLQHQFRIGLSRIERNIRDKITTSNDEDIALKTIINGKPLLRSIKEFFNSSQLSQFMDQVNPLAELTHKRRISALGPGGLNRDHTGFVVRDIHPSHYGRICPIETPEGTNAGLIGSLALNAKVNKYGFIEAPFFLVEKGRVCYEKAILYLNAEEEDQFRIAPADILINKNGYIKGDIIPVRYYQEFITASPEEVDYIAISPIQILSPATSLIPFVEHDDANRALMGSNMQRQAVPLVHPERPIVGTGLETHIARDSGMVIVSKDDGEVTNISANRIIIKTLSNQYRTYFLQKYQRSNQDTCINQTPIVYTGEKVKVGQVIADGSATEKGSLALGKNILVAYMPWEGYNYEDAFIISERLVYDDVYTSIHIERYEIEARITKLGAEKITRDIPNVGENNLKHLDERGIVKIGTWVDSGDILVGKVTPKGDSDNLPETRLLKAIFGTKNKESNVRDSSLRMPNGSKGRVLDIKLFGKINDITESSNIIVKVYIAQKRKIQVGDKMAGRHGNKGVISRILPREDMPYLPDGTPVDIILNPLGVPSRMNIGQLFECLLGLAGYHLNKRFTVIPFDEMYGVESSRKLINKKLKEARDVSNLEWLFNINCPGKITLFDGRTGEPFDNPVTVGFAYMLKLIHLVDDKMHARSTGPYALITQQPLGGRAQNGGQRLGEMEVWALEAYGAAYTLQELLTIKSDDMYGRVEALHAMIKGNPIPQAGIPESFKVLIRELQALGLDVVTNKISNELESSSNKIEVDILSNQLTETQNNSNDKQLFDYISISLAPPEKLLKWGEHALSNGQIVGEVTSTETINYKTLKPEMGGLFCERIFGPVKNWECHCGKYKRFRAKNLVCERCGVEVTESKVRRYRMGYINLSAPVTHIWYVKGLPSYLAIILDMRPKDIEQVVYYNSYIVIHIQNKKLKLSNGRIIEERSLLNEKEWEELEDKIYLKNSNYDDESTSIEKPIEIEIGIGAEAIKKLLSKLNLDIEEENLRKYISHIDDELELFKAIRRLRLLQSLISSQTNPRWTVLEVLPVLPPDLRPMIQLDGGRFASSDLNDLYRKVIHRNNRLLKLQQILAPEIIIRNEKRMLQESVDALIDNGRRGKTVVGANNRPLKSLSDILEGKQGRFRQNLLGKRVDYSGRSVIVVDPKLKLYQCGLPKEMAVILFEPFIINALIHQGLVYNIKAAKKLIQRNESVVREILEEVIKGHPILLNRAPTLHRLGIQSFEPIIVEGRAIKLHPLVCPAFNADFDGDQMAVHVPLSIEAQTEARILMFAPHNFLSPATGNPIIIPSQDMVLGCYYLTADNPYSQSINENYFSSFDDALRAYENNLINLHSYIWVRFDGEVDDEFNNNLVFSQKITFFFQKTGITAATIIADELKTLGFHYATKAGLSLSLEDLKIPPVKRELINYTDKQIKETENRYLRGEITIVERLQKVVDAWNNVSEDLKNELVNYFINKDPLNPIYMMAFSGARGNISQVRQLVGMRGLMADPQGQIIDLPIKSNFREGLTSTEYIISSYGARKGIVDMALRTADSGYLTRRLVDVSQDYIIKSKDCRTKQGIYLTDLKDNDKVIIPLEKRLIGRVLAEQIYDPYNNKIIANYNQDIGPSLAKEIIQIGIKEVFIRSPLTCEAKQGVCQYCYGWNLAYSKIANLGEAAGIIAAQSIGEPGTQLTMRTFHTGGVFTGQLSKQIRAPFEGRILPFNLRKASLTRTRYGDKALIIEENLTVSIINEEKIQESFELKPGVTLFIIANQLVKKNDLIAEFPLSSRLITEKANKPVITDFSGEVYFSNLIVEEKVDLSEDIKQNQYIKRTTRNDGKICILSGQIYNFTSEARFIVREDQYVYKEQTLATIQLISKFGGKVYKIYNSKFDEYINAELAHCSIIYNGIQNLYIDKSNSVEKYSFNTKNGSKLILKFDRDECVLSNQIKPFAEEIIDKYSTETGGIIKYDTVKASRRIKDNEGYELIEEGVVFWIPEVTYELNLDQSLIKVKNGEFIKSSQLINEQKSSPYEGVIELVKKNNIVKEAILKIGKLYPIMDPKLIKIVKKEHQQIIYKGNVLFRYFNIQNIEVAFVEYYEYLSKSYLFLRKAYPYMISKNTENFFTVQNFSQQISSLLMFNKIYLRYKDRERIKSLTGVNLVKNIWICKIQSNLPHCKLDFEIVGNKTKTYSKLEIFFLESTSLKKQNYIKLNKNLTITRVFVNLRQILTPYTIIAQTDILCNEDGKVLRIQTSNTDRKDILILTEKDKRVYINNSNKWNVKDGDWIKAGDKISDNLIAKDSGQVLECNQNCLTVRKGKIYLISVGTVLLIKNRDLIKRGDSIAVLSYERFKTADIVQGLPKVEEILEARKVKEQIILSKDSGHLYLESDKNILWIFDYNNLKVLSRQNLSNSEIDKLQLMHMHYTNLAEPIIDGPYNTHMLLNLYFKFFIKHIAKYLPQKKDICVELSFKKIQKSLINEIQYVYQSQGADIADKHIEVIIRKMTSRVEMTNCENNEICTGELINLAQIKSMNLGIDLLEKLKLKKEIKKKRKHRKRKEQDSNNEQYNEQEIDRRKKILVQGEESENFSCFHYKPVLLGITKASLNTKSFISAASFQETRRVLTRAAFENHIDWLKGLKENVIIGRLIPAGTGFKDFYLYKKQNYEETILSIKKYNIEDNIIYKILSNRM
eukprot:jgi/Galph1/4587/GphlegSOOS_G3290.1